MEQYWLLVISKLDVVIDLVLIELDLEVAKVVFARFVVEICGAAQMLPCLSHCYCGSDGAGVVVS